MARFVSIFSILAIMVIPVLASETNSGNSSAGQQLVQDLNCTTCHALAGKGAGMAPDLGRTVARNYSPAYVAGKIWSHAPAIWSRLRGQGISSPKLTEERQARQRSIPGDAMRGMPSNRSGAWDQGHVGINLACAR
jgi:cytochrome c2